jgi:hypothetical protein
MSLVGLSRRTSDIPIIRAQGRLTSTTNQPVQSKWLEFFHLKRLKYNSNAAVDGGF